MSDDAQIAAGREAWATIHHATSFESWKAIALAVAIGRKHALREAGSNTPYGKKYSVAISHWLDANEFREMPFGIRSACCVLADNIDAIQSWRATLPASEQASQNHPQVIMRRYRRATEAEVSQVRQHVVSKVQGKAAKRAACTSVRWPQAAIKRAGDAMRQSWSNDVYKLATIALQAAIRTEADILELLLPEPPPKPAPRQIAAPVAAELHAKAMSDLAARADRVAQIANAIYGKLIGRKRKRRGGGNPQVNCIR
jgi:hypothetical protein